VELLDADKYNWGKALKTPALKYDFLPVAHKHAFVDPTTMVVDSAFSLIQQDVSDAVNTLATKDHPDGIGVMIVIETLDKPAVKATGFIVFFDLASKGILHLQRVSGVPIGFGFRNYWAASFHDMMEAAKMEVMPLVKARFTQKK